MRTESNLVERMASTEEFVSIETNRKTIGIVSLVCLVIGNMIGSGVYVSSSYALGSLGDAKLVLLAWAIGGVHAICGAIAYAAISKRLPVSGGEYAFLTHFVHPAVGFMAGWISLIAGFTAPIATAALVFGEYACEDGQGSSTARWIATAAIGAGALFHIINLRTGSFLNNAIVGMKFVGFAIFAIACIVYLSWHSHSGVYVAEGSTMDASTHWMSRLNDSKVQMSMLATLYYIALSYTGFNASIYIAGEFAQKENSTEGTALTSSIVPRSMIIACICVTLIYLALNTLFLYCAEPQTIVSGRDYFVSDVAMNVGGSALRWVMRIAIALSAATSVLAMLATGPRVYAQMASDGRLPTWLVSKDGVPRLAIAFQAIASCVIVWLSTVLATIKYLGITLTVCGALATSTLWIARSAIQKKLPVRWYEDAALGVYLLGALVILITAYQIERPQFLMCVATFVSGLVVYMLFPKEKTAKV